MLCGSALKNKGVQLLLDAVVDYLPSPDDVPPVIGIEPEDERRRAARSRATTSRSRRWRSRSSPTRYVGRLAYFRVYSGKLDSGIAASTTRRGEKTERFGRLLQMHANQREDIDEVCAGGIAARWA